ncbi:MAG TPA: hypothetical protein VN812_03735, partial [Candidatus Acidoferrales bacterium]|nr:hypothetical protein [Candidatus Acidoferrales bacterium]
MRHRARGIGLLLAALILPPWVSSSRAADRPQPSRDVNVERQDTEREVADPEAVDGERPARVTGNP